MQLRRAVVTGLGALTPIGATYPEFWEALVNGVSGSNLITHFDTAQFKTKFACELKNYDPANYFDRKEARKIDPYAQYAMIAAEEAIKNSGINLDTVNKNRVGVIWASGIGGIETFQNEIKNYVTGGLVPRFNPFFIPKMISDIAAGLISIKYGFHGPNFGTVSACASSSNAIIDAVAYIRLGKADVFVVGGSEAAITETGVGGFSVMQALSTNNDNYASASRPFDKDRDGFVMGEGGGGLIVEEYEHAKKRGATIYAEIVGFGMSADAHHLTAPHPEGLGAQLVMTNALEDAGLSPDAIDYINVHGTSTPLGDIAETKAIKNVFGDHAFKLNISSTKSMTGHLLGAAGAVEAIAAILSTKFDVVPPTINHFTDDPELDNNLNFTFNKAQHRKVNYALSNTFGFGGHNTSIIFKKYSE